MTKQPITRHTPIEVHFLGNRRVYVKRDDLFGLPPLPPLGKLRSLEALLASFASAGVSLVGCWDTRVSKLGQGVAILAARVGLRAVIAYPERKGQSPPESVRIAAEYGAEIYPLRGNFPRIAWSQARHYVEDQGGVMLPFGLECRAAVESIAREAEHVSPAYYRGGTIVVSAGSGVTAAGIALGAKADVSRIIALSSGRSPAELRRTIARYVNPVPASLQILPPIMPYGEPSSVPCSFPAHPHYDLKAWHYLGEHIGTLNSPVLFWNVGA